MRRDCLTGMLIEMAGRSTLGTDLLGDEASILSLPDDDSTAIQALFVSLEDSTSKIRYLIPQKVSEICIMLPFSFRGCLFRVFCTIAF